MVFFEVKKTCIHHNKSLKGSLVSMGRSSMTLDDIQSTNTFLYPNLSGFLLT